MADPGVVGLTAARLAEIKAWAEGQPGADWAVPDTVEVLALVAAAEEAALLKVDLQHQCEANHRHDEDRIVKAREIDQLKAERDRLRAAVGRVPEQVDQPARDGYQFCKACGCSWWVTEPPAWDTQPDRTEHHRPDCWWAGLQAAVDQSPKATDSVAERDRSSP